MHGVRAGLAALLLTIGSAAAAEPGLTELEQGIGAYRSGDYDNALSAFEAARELGLDSSRLHFNLGLSHYQLGQYPEARTEFERLQLDEAYRPLADFHLALVFARQGERERAQQLLRNLADNAPQEALRRRASVTLERLTERQERATAYSAYVLAGVGGDSNPGLFDVGGDAPEGAESGSAELLGTLERSLGTGSGTATILRGGAYALQYEVDNGLDQDGLFLGVRRESTPGERRRGYSVEASTSRLDGIRFIDSFEADLFLLPARGSGLAWRGELAYLNAAGDLAQLQGWRARTDLGWSVRAGPTLLRVGYQLELNDRNDLDTGDEFSSNSPLRQRAELLLDYPPGPGWRLEGALRYRYSHYRDPERFFEGATLREQRRIESLVQAGLQVRRRLTAQANALLDYEYNLNAASTDTFDYQRHVILLGLEWLPVF